MNVEAAEKVLGEIPAFLEMEVYRHLESRRSGYREMAVKTLVDAALESTDMRVQAAAFRVRWSEVVWGDLDELIREAREKASTPPEEARSEYRYDTP